ncbi:D-alanyl-D-alanine carboxypeptidase [Streptomyces sp. NPDC048566]|uniref:D-alanyl-D-alanine carboxypeptidase n=1 Tax=Streptomyces sp. NPDC048566 TaxID=3365569 RepID=UPI0037248C71
MAMARERAATVRVDRATAVFSTKALSADAPRSADAPLPAGSRSDAPAGGATAGEPAEASAGSAVTAGSGTGADAPEGGAEGDTRLRAAVAAWVNGTDDPEAPAAPLPGTGASGAGSASGGAPADRAERGDGPALPRRTVAPQDAAPAPADAEDADPTDSADTTDATHSAEEAETAADSARGTRPDPTGASDAAEPAATADAVSGAEPDERPADGAPEPAAGEAPDDASGATGPAGEEPASASAAARDGKRASTEPVDAPPVTAPASGEPEDAKPAPAAPEDAEPPATAPEDAKPASGASEDAKPVSGASENAKPASAGAPQDRPGSTSPEGEAAQASRAASGAGAGTGSTTGTPATTKGAPARATGDTDDGTDAAAGPRTSAGDGDTAPQPPVDAAPAEAPPVDRATGVFRKPRPAVDQPTTMLKLGDAARRPAGGKAADAAAPPAGKPAADAPDTPSAGPAADPSAEPVAKPGGEPERTSRFVALKSLDEAAAPARPKPPAAPAGTDRPASATAVVPQVGPERTTQQPLPPKPPLDLLAELTNTPPPPQTPVRTLVRRVKIWTPLVLLLVVIFAVAQAFRPLPTPALALTADETYTFDGGTLDLPWPGQGQSAIEVDGVGSLGTDGKQAPAPVASVAKIMTAYVILKEHPLKGNEDGEKITVDQQAEDESKLPDESTAAMSKGQQFTERQMLQMLMIPSGNNVARLLARWDSDSKSFLAKMNAAAKDLGMTNSTYTDPSGLKKTTVSTAVDQIKLAKKVMQNDVFRSVVGMAKADIPGLDNPIYNNNDLLVQQVGVIGLKTGSSTPAGGNLVWAATKNVDGKTRTIYGAVMNQDAGTGKVWDSLHLAISNSQKLIDKVQKSLTTATVVKKGQVVGSVDDQLGGRTPVVATRDMTAVGWPGLKTRLSIGAGDTEVPHTGKAGTVVGRLTVGDGSSRAVTIPVALQSDLAEPGLGAKLTRLG